MNKAASCQRRTSRDSLSFSSLSFCSSARSARFSWLSEDASPPGGSSGGIDGSILSPAHQSRRSHNTLPSNHVSSHAKPHAICSGARTRMNHLSCRMTCVTQELQGASPALPPSAAALLKVSVVGAAPPAVRMLALSSSPSFTSGTGEGGAGGPSSSTRILVSCKQE